MRIQNNDEVQKLSSNTSNNQSKKSIRERSKTAKNKDTILASELRVGDSVTSKKIKSQKEALKIVIKQFSNDKKTDDKMDYLSKRSKELEQEIKNSKDELNNIENTKKQIKESYGITEDSQEEVNLNLLEKQRQSLIKGSKIKLTDEEKEKIKKMGPVTDYQSAILDLNKMKDAVNVQIDNANKEKDIANGTIEGIKKELLKIHPMVDAQESKQDILEQANKEVIGMLINQAKDSIDKKQDEIEEKAEKAAEEKEKEEKEKQISKEKEVDSADNLKDLSKIQKADNEQNQVEVEIKALIVNNKITLEDTKGIVVDEKL